MSRTLAGTIRRSTTLLATVGSLVLLIACGGEEDPFSYDRASVVLVDLSGLRADRLEAGDELRALASESVAFQWAFTPSPHAGPSRAALLSGRYPVALGLLAEGGTLSEETVTLAERLAESGYRTAAFVDSDAGSDGPVDGVEQGFDTWQSVSGGFEGVLAPALEWLRGGDGSPFFLYLQASDLVAAPEELATSTGAAEGDGSSADEPSAAEAAANEAAGRERLDALYDARVRTVDAQIGELLRALEEDGLGGAVLALTSDRGVELAEHGEVGDGDVHATVARVPLLLRLPEPTGRVEPRITDLVDLAPTLLDLVGVEPVGGMQGESLVAVLDERGRPPYLAFTDSIEPDGGLAVAMAGYRLVLHRADDRAELYRLSDDPFELADISAAEPEKVAVLRRRLEEWQLGVLGTGAGGEGQTADEEMLEQLRNLGYVQ